MHGGGDGGADEAVEPVVVGLFWTRLPFVDGASSPLSLDEVLGGDLLGEHAVLISTIAEDGEASAIAHGNGKPCMRERLPPVGVVDHVSDRSLAMDGWHSPVESNAIARPAFVFTEWIR